MSELLLLGLLVACIFASALYSGSEIGFYSLSRVRVGLEARRGVFSARMIERLLRDDSTLLITILIGNNLVIELATHLGDEVLHGRGFREPWASLVLTLSLTPVLFLFGEVLPKEIFRRRPHRMVSLWVPFVQVSRLIFWPLSIVLRFVTAMLERLFRVPSGATGAFFGRDVLLSLLAEGKRSGALPERAEVLARNALALRSLPISKAMVPWSEVVKIESAQPREAKLEVVRGSTFSRLPVVDAAGVFEGYVHQLEVLAAGADTGSSTKHPGDPLERPRPLACLAPETPVDRALLTLRGSGQRVLVVGTKEEPVGLVTVKDLVEEITGDLAVW